MGVEVMKIAVKRLARDEKGHVLTLVLILLVIGGLIIAPLLGLMGTGLIAGQIYERKTDELYAADAGVEYAIWKIITDPPDTLWVDSNIGYVNEKVVWVSIEPVYEPSLGQIYKITSNATTDSNSSTTIEAYVKPKSFLDNAITSKTDIDLHHANIVGDVQYGGDLTETNSNIDGEEINETYAKWPEADELSSHYLKDVEGLDPYPYPSLNVLEYPTIPPLYRGNWTDPEQKFDLKIYNNCANQTTSLEGTVYVTGNLDIAMTNLAFTLDLNGQTIYCEGDVRLGTKVTLTGTGCIIAEGDIVFQPSMESNPDDFVFVMSIGGTVNFRPSVEPSGGTFYGSLAGDVSVDLQNASFYWQPLGEGEELNFPGEGYQTMEILTWEINPN